MNMEAFLEKTRVVNVDHPTILHRAETLFHSSQTDVEKAEAAFLFVRDNISHSWDIQGQVVTVTASEVLAAKEGICYAKANLLAALLRGEGIPTGFCYQRLRLFDTPDSAFCLHA
ncbi:transglutaminase superfamily protein [Aureibacillus halotolerans]|uniref:Transglutaminase superfamily protein n=1 Tax=Aureibacillus halotolerans TaxID=1508390 RepID=A0A4R6TWD5_9BACI|nr:transglutaminase superfamily protein [Aureibacillus halotolerans]